MHFEYEDLPLRAEYVPTRDLRVGRVYFHLAYVDEGGLVPVLEPVVFIGSDLENESEMCVYFQDAASYLRGVRAYPATADGDEDAAVLAPVVYSFPSSAGNVFTYEHAIEELIRCAMKRNRSTEESD
jgi:hypothetical protein